MNKNDVNVEYEKLSNLADKHIQQIKLSNKKENAQTLAAAMFVQSHKDYIRFLFKDVSIVNRQDAALKYIKSEVSNFNEDTIRKELFKIGFYSDRFVKQITKIMFFIPFILINFIMFTKTSTDMLDIFVINSIIAIIGYAMIVYFTARAIYNSRIRFYRVKDFTK